jgi:hypothetical protein
MSIPKLTPAASGSRAAGGTNGDRLAGFGFEPAAQRSPTCEHEGMRAFTVDHGKLDVDVERRGSDG